jgi:hypothetical protein
MRGTGILQGRPFTGTGLGHADDIFQPFDAVNHLRVSTPHGDLPQSPDRPFIAQSFAVEGFNTQSMCKLRPSSDL